MHEYEISILSMLKKQRSASLEEIEKGLGISKDSAVWAIENLSASGAVNVEKEYNSVPKLTKEGSEYKSQFPEEKLVFMLEKSGGAAKTASLKNDIGLIWAKKNGWITMEGDQIKITESGKQIASGNKEYSYRELLEFLGKSVSVSTKLLEERKDEITTLKKRNLIEIYDKGEIRKVLITEKGLSLAGTEMEEGIASLSRELITSGRWKKEKLRKYDIYAASEEVYPARQHPMHEFIDVIRRTWFNMGFKEVSGPIIESAFWNFDALFSPQDHPTRDMQDTFFLKNPSKLDISDIALMNRVKKMHVSNWKEKWKASIAEQALLRTHTTSVSARYINKFANEVEGSYPLKLFSVGRIFRNESIDYKHLAEFYQTDGIIIGNNLTLSNLMHVLKEFYNSIGIDAKFKPSYFPFVEPGLECNYYDEKIGDEIELCGGGIIRKEITKAMGTNKTVLAWGGGLERLMFRVMDIKTITELYKNDIGWLRKRSELKVW